MSSFAAATADRDSPERQDDDAAILSLVSDALRGVRFGEVIVVVQDGRVERIERVHKSRPYRAPKNG